MKDGLFEPGDVLEVVDGFQNDENNLEVGMLVTFEKYSNLGEAKQYIKIKKVPGCDGVEWYAYRFKLHVPVVKEEKHIYKVGDKVVINFPHNAPDDRKERWRGGTIEYDLEFEKGRVVSLKANWNGHKDVWYTNEGRWVYDERAFSPYKEKEEVKPMLMKDLRAIASQRKLPGYSRMNKAQLSALLVAKQAAPLPAKPLEKPLIPTLGEELRKKTGDAPGTCSYAIEFSDGSRRFQVRDACHARLKKAGIYEDTCNKEKNVSIVAAVCDIAGHYNGAVNKEAYKRAITYLLTASPYKQAYLTKTWEEALKEGVYLNVKQESNSHCVTAAIALREASEFPMFTKMFWRLVNDGFSESVSWFACRHFREDDKLRYVPCAGGHSTISFAMDWEELLKFWKEGFHKLKDNPMSEKAGNYRVFASIATDSGKNPKLMDVLKKFFSPPAEDAWGNPVPPFPVRNLYKGMELLEKELA